MENFFLSCSRRSQILHNKQQWTGLSNGEEKKVRTGDSPDIRLISTNKSSQWMRHTVEIAKNENNKSRYRYSAANCYLINSFSIIKCVITKRWFERLVFYISEKARKKEHNETANCLFQARLNKLGENIFSIVWNENNSMHTHRPMTHEIFMELIDFLRVCGW